jgi:transposase
MRHLRELLRLYHAGLPQHVIAKSLGLAQGTVSKYLSRARAAGLTWPLPSDLDDDERLEARLFPPPPDLPAALRPKPDWAEVHRELRRPDVTLTLLWEEYKAREPDGFSYSWFCDLYKDWAGRLKPTLRQIHVAGEKLFVDYAGRTLEVIDPLTGEGCSVQIFVAVLGASNFTYAEATFTQTLPDWIGAHGRAFAYLGGTARQTVSDNLKAGVTKACFHEPMVNRTYADLARHYGTAIVPARPYKPRDKAKVEVGVQIVGRWILARLRNRRFFSLAALNEAIRALLDDLNDRPLRGWGRSRRQLFEEIERPALTPLPPEPYETPSGSAAGWGSTTMSRSPSTTTAFLIPWRARRSRPGSPPPPSRSSIAANASPRTYARPARTGPPPCRSTCPARIGATATGRMSACGARRPRLAPTPPRSSI